jgi:hypothetical protein
MHSCLRVLEFEFGNKHTRVLRVSQYRSTVFLLLLLYSSTRSTLNFDTVLLELYVCVRRGLMENDEFRGPVEQIRQIVPCGIHT